jgi:hypothetical protein
MRGVSLLSFILVVAGFSCFAPVSAQAGAPPQNAATQASSGGGQLSRREQPTWRFEFANDTFFDSDNGFTSGFAFQKHSTVSNDIDDLDGVRAFGKGLAKRLLPQSSDLFYRKAFALGQNFTTPEDLLDPNIILNDAPYFGMLAVQSSWIAFNDTRFTGFGITLGVTGEASLAEQVQTGVHSLVDADDPQGWDNQLDTEPVINLHFMKKRKLWNKPSFDGAFNFDVSVGNFLTGIDAGFEMRFGRKPGGFSYEPNPVGRNLIYDATIPQAGGGSEFYGTFSVKAWAWAVFMPLEGNTFASGNEWTDNNVVEPENVIGQAVFGIHYVRPRWGLHASWTFATDNVDDSLLPPGREVENNFGMLMYEWRFGG